MMSISLSLYRSGSSTLSKQDHCQEYELVTILSSGEHTPKEPDKLSSSGWHVSEGTMLQQVRLGLVNLKAIGLVISLMS